MAAIDHTTRLEEIAALVSQALENAGIPGILSGGAAVSVYSDNEYESADLDFITSVRNDKIAAALQPLGFVYEAGKREFLHPDTDYYIEFPSGPLAFGDTVVREQSGHLLETEFGPLRIVTPTQSVLDRLAHYLAWNDNQAFDQAAMVVRRCRIDWDEVTEWLEREGASMDVLERLRVRAQKSR